MTSAATSPGAMPMPTPIPLPENFPVTWDSPMDSMILWEREQLHFAHPASPLALDIVPLVGEEVGKALRKMGAPVQSMIMRPFNTYIYWGAIPDFSLMEGAEERVKETVGRIGFTMYQTWLTELMPQIEAMSNEILGFDYGSAGDPQLAAWAQRTVDLFIEAWRIHFEMMPGFYTAPAFKEACHAMFGMEGLDAYEMMQGMPNKSIESSSKLWRLSQAAPAAVRDAVTSLPSKDAMAKLQATPEGAEFLAALHTYLQEYGWRTGTFDFMEPSWVERPDLALDQVRLMLRVKSDPADDQRRGFERAEKMAAECRAKLAGAPEVLGQFEFLLAGARAYPQLQENHNFYLDQKLFAIARLPFIEAGHRLAKRGVIAEAEDAPFLTLAELLGALNGDATVRKDEVAARRANLEYWKTIVPPVAVGSTPPMENPDPFLKDFFGRAVIEPAADRTLQGTASSRGTVTGIARVIRNLSEADRVEDGDILVCEMTTPAWTPLFASLGGIISDSGGPLSHCAVVAREYGIPCVTGTRIATRTIVDGSRVSIDGGTGLVKLL